MYEDDPDNNAQYKGTMVIELQSVQKPGIVDRNGSTYLTTIEEFYSGCWCRVEVHCFSWENKGKIGVSFGMDNIQKVKNDSKFSGGPEAHESFDAVEGYDDDDDGDFLDDDDSDDDDIEL